LVCPSYAVGHQITAALARAAHPWVNIRVETIAGLACALVARGRAAQAITPLSEAAQLSLLENVVETSEFFAAHESYFGRLHRVPGLAPALLVGLRHLRLAGVPADKLREEGTLVSTVKARELAQLHRRYEQLLDEHAFADDATVLKRALEALNDRPPDSSAGARFLVMSEMRLCGLEAAFLRALGGEELYLLDHDAVETLDPHPQSASRALAGYAQSIKPLPHEDSPLGSLFSVRVPATSPTAPIVLRRALGETNEVRDVLRSILDRQVPLDTVEVLHTDSATYVPLLFESAERMSIPCTF
jgi:hypothetical protein